MSFEIHSLYILSVTRGWLREGSLHLLQLKEVHGSMLEYCSFPVTITQSYTLFSQNGNILLGDLNKNHMY